MKTGNLNIYLEYICSDNEVLMIVKRSKKGNSAYLMKKDGYKKWHVIISKDKEEKYVSYFYIVVSSEIIDKQGELIHQDISSMILRREEGPMHIINSYDVYESITIDDSWHNLNSYMPLNSTPFTDVFNKVEIDKTVDYGSYKDITFEVFAPFVVGNRKVGIIGSSKSLGEWDASKALVMTLVEFPIWRVSIPIFDEYSLIEYKVIIQNGDSIESYEVGDNRVFDSLENREQTLISIYDPYFGEPKVKFAGFSLPVFSMRSANNYGVGDFTSLKLAVDWAVKSSQRVIQLLPINDTTKDHSWNDSYPYSPISTIALNPLYIDVEAVGLISNLEQRRRLKIKAVELNYRSEFNIEEVDKLKWEYLRTIFTQTADTLIGSKEFIKWFKTNMSWIEPYAFFCALREKYKTIDFNQWSEYRVFNLSALRDLAMDDSVFNDEVMLHVFVQYHLHLQLLDASTYARKNGVILKGDIQIGVNTYSVDTWQYPELFKSKSQIGAPPDAFAADGQNWGFPAYDWDEMEKQNYKWWILRFNNLAKYFDSYRIDHLLGFFRIWEIPINAVSGLVGHFSPALGFTYQEISERNILLDKERLLVPVITEEFLLDIFAKRRLMYVKSQFFIHNEDGTYKFKPEFDTYEKIVASPKSDMYHDLRVKLKTFFIDVLFVRDIENSEILHPRILGIETFTYKYLSEEQKGAYKALYIDYFYYRNEQFWKESALRKLPAIIDATKMLVCVEDLGMIPSIVPGVMNELQLLSLEIERMPKTCGDTFSDTTSYPYYSVATTSTHDMTPIRMWWEEDEALTQRYYNEVLKLDGEAPKILDAPISYEIVLRNAMSNSMLMILPIQDWLAIDEVARRKSYMKERVNVPSDSKNMWKYRMHLTFEQLLNYTALNKKIVEIIECSDRVI